MAPEDLLLATRDLIRDRGLARGSLEDDDGSVCLVGAVHLATCGRAVCSGPHDATWRDAYVTLVDECRHRFGVWITVANNDCIADVDEACDVLEAAAKRAASGGGLDD